MSYLVHKKSEAMKALKAALRRVKTDVRREPLKLLVAVIAGLAASFLFGIPVAVIWTLFILFLVYDWNMAAPIFGGVISFALCVYFALMGKAALAEAALVYSYFLFGISAILWFVRYGYKLV